MSEIRFNHIKGTWATVAEDRSGRRDFFITGGDTRKKSKCPFCDINNGQSLPPIFKITKSDNPDENSLIVTPNKYPVMRIEGDLKGSVCGIFESLTAIGAHEVIIDSPRHGIKAGDYTVQEIFNLFKAFKVRIEDLTKDIRFRYMAAFKNIGFEAGEFISHPHAQLIAAPAVPADVEKIMIRADKYYREKERCIFCDTISEERNGKKRIVAENHEYVAFCPYASESPFETVVYPKKHEALFSRSRENSLMQLADIVRDIFSRMAILLDNPCLCMALRLSPMKPSRPDMKGYLEYIENSYHWHIEIKPIITRPSGFYWSSGIMVNPLKPEEAAQYLREVSAI